LRGRPGVQSTIEGQARVIADVPHTWSGSAGALNHDAWLVQADRPDVARVLAVGTS
jgi:hypothetical protein